jgi:hypothetical protein
MNWRPWMVVLALALCLVFSLALVVQEPIPDLEVKEEVTLDDEPLRHLNYVPSARLNNFLEMGMDEELAQTTSALVAGLQPNRERYLKLLDEQALEVGVAFCPSPSGLPQPYAAMQFLVVQEAGKRDVVDALGGLFRFEVQPWYTKDGRAPQVYNTLERTARRKQDATLMGVSAVLLSREEDAIRERGPWATSLLGGVGFGAFATLKSENPRIAQLAAEYFALVHYLTELANEQDGICS